jgi:hypothetical protein
MHDAGHVPYTKFMLHDVEEENVPFLHQSEKLVIAFRLINRSPGTPLYKMKNLQVCENCHTYTKFVSKRLGDQSW